MSKSSGSTGSIKVDDDFLNDFANKQLASFTTAVENSGAVTQVYDWANPLALPNLSVDTSSATSPSVYDQVMGPVSTTLPAFSTTFTGIFKSIYTQITAMDTEMQRLSTSLLAAHTTLNNGEDDSLTTAQMMELLNPALGSSTTGNPPS